MDYVLIYSSSSEIQTRLVEGKLRSHGLKIKSDFLHTNPTKTLTHSLFGIYVLEKDVNKAKEILSL